MQKGGGLKNFDSPEVDHKEESKTKQTNKQTKNKQTKNLHFSGKTLVYMTLCGLRHIF